MEIVIRHNDSDIFSVRMFDGGFNQFVTGEQLKVDHIYQTAVYCCTVKRNIVFDRQRLFTAFFSASEGEQQRLISHHITDGARSFQHGIRGGDIAKMVNAPFQNVEIRFAIGQRFAFYRCDVFTHQRDNDLWRALANYEVFYGYGFHLLPFEYITNACPSGCKTHNLFHILQREIFPGPEFELFSALP